MATRLARRRIGKRVKESRGRTDRMAGGISGRWWALASGKKRSADGQPRRKDRSVGVVTARLSWRSRGIGRRVGGGRHVAPDGGRFGNYAIGAAGDARSRRTPPARTNAPENGRRADAGDQRSRCAAAATTLRP